jgi:hypothetical protein
MLPATAIGMLAVVNRLRVIAEIKVRIRPLTLNVSFAHAKQEILRKYSVERELDLF